MVNVVGNGQEPLNHLVVYPIKGTKGEQTQQGTIPEKRLKRSRLNNFLLGMKERILNLNNYFTVAVRHQKIKSNQGYSL